MKFAGGLSAFAALAAISLSASGCIWLAVPSLAYQGYQHENGKSSSGQQASARKAKKPPASPPPAPASEIE